ncbi:MAG TPA: hypothetical protein VFV82_03945, partial [Candidatus Binatia bacterium]|nr:hypothetical protein [Candidatus Binatia bacterium]
MKPSGSATDSRDKSKDLAAGVRSALRALDTPIQFLSGVGPKRAGQLASLGIRSVGDLLYH